MIRGQWAVCGCERACAYWCADRPQRGMTCLHWACHYAHTATAEMLVGNGADMRATDRVRWVCAERLQALIKSSRRKAFCLCLR